jgi:hypothetical protein
MARTMLCLCPLIMWTGCRQVRSIATEAPTADSGAQVIGVPEVAGPPALAVWVHGDKPAPGQPRIRVISAIWRNGDVVWSQDRLYGGPPYYVAHIDAKRVDIAIGQLESMGVFSTKNRFIAAGCVVLDLPYTEIYLSNGIDSILTASCHEICETNPAVAVTSSGIVAIGEHSRTEQLRGDTEEFQQFRLLWSEIQSTLRGLVPTEGRPCQGTPLEGWDLLEKGKIWGKALTRESSGLRP